MRLGSAVLTPGRFAVPMIGIAAVAATLAATIALSAPLRRGVTGAPGPRIARAVALPVTLSTRPGSYLGVYERGAPESYAQVEAFARATGSQPNIVLSYGYWGAAFPVGFARQAHAHGAMPFIQIEPWHISMAAIASGRSDSYLASYARAVAAYRYPVLLGFGHEMNGNWYPWGWTHTSPATWVAAWRHVVTLFRRTGARNVTWVWTVNEEAPGDGPLRAYWPGWEYVGWIGITGYIFFAQETFLSAYRSTIAALRTFAHRPILISETAVGQLAGQARKIPGLFSLIRRYRLLGFVWFDVNQDAGPYHQHWRVEGNRAALRALRRGLSRLGAR